MVELRVSVLGCGSDDANGDTLTYAWVSIFQTDNPDANI